MFVGVFVSMAQLAFVRSLRLKKIKSNYADERNNRLVQKRKFFCNNYVCAKKEIGTHVIELRAFCV